ncbi:MAG: ComF family protein [Bacteroidales bacterium]|nr:ComF family protein [Candidatus Cryptobacteroides aphodequi]
MSRNLLELDLTSYLRSAADLALPRVCVVCGRTLNLGERHICLCCGADLPLTHFSRLSHNPMALAYNAAIAADATQEDSVTERENVAGKREDSMAVREDDAGGRSSGWEPFQYATALYHYVGDYSKISRALKYRHDFGAGRHFARMLGRELAASNLFADVDLVTCVPLHFTRRLSRGHNQAEVIAKEVWREMRRGGTRASGDGRAAKGSCEDVSEPLRQSPDNGLLFDPRLLSRVRRTASQARLSPGAKARNVRGAFRVRPSALWQDKKRMCHELRHILVLDDVFTTGSTLAACHDALREVLGPEVRISVATLAFAGGENTI